MDKFMFQTARTDEERAVLLKDNCDMVEKVTYNKKYPVDEVEEMRDRLIGNVIRLRAVSEEKKEVMKQYNERIKLINQENNELTESITDGSRTVEEICYKFVDYDERMVGYYNGDGELVKERPARKNELQKTIYREMNGTNE